MDSLKNIRKWSKRTSIHPTHSLKKSMASKHFSYLSGKDPKISPPLLIPNYVVVHKEIVVAWGLFWGFLLLDGRAGHGLALRACCKRRSRWYPRRWSYRCCDVPCRCHGCPQENWDVHCTCGWLRPENRVESWGAIILASKKNFTKLGYHIMC